MPPDRGEKPPSANDDRKPAIATSISRKRARFMRTEPAEPAPDDPEADAEMRTWIERAKWGRGRSEFHE